MKFLAPLGLLALLGIAVLILIYLLKPNYQQKFVSSTFIWKLSLKYKKQAIPISRIRNLFILICQILVIVLCTLIISKLVIEADIERTYPEKIAIIDASASMLALQAEGTRFEKAVREVKELGQQTINDNGSITVILAGKEASSVISRADSDSLDEFNSRLNDLIRLDERRLPRACTFGKSDINGAMNLAEAVLNENPRAEVLFFTATEYADVGNVAVKDVSETEWNAAILGCTADIEENYHIFTVDVAVYGLDMDLKVNFKVVNPNSSNVPVEDNITVSCYNNQPVTVSFSNLQITSFEYVEITILAEDSFSYDNSFYLYGGRRDTIKIQYTSTKRNTFFGGITRNLRESLKTKWDIEITETHENDAPKLSGFDLYIFEHKMPDILPTDGVVLMVNPDAVPENLRSSLVLGDKINSPSDEDFFRFSAGTPHRIMNYIDPNRISVSQYTTILSYNRFQPLMYCFDDPVFLVRNEVNSKIAILSFDVTFTEIPMMIDFPILVYNLFNYFMPSTISDFVFDVDEKVSLNARGPVLTISGSGLEERDFTNFPAEVSAPYMGLYTLTQTLLSGRQITNRFFVKIAATESDFTRIEKELRNPAYPDIQEAIDFDLILYLAATLFAFLFVERWLQTKEQM